MLKLVGRGQRATQSAVQAGCELAYKQAPAHTRECLESSTLRARHRQAGVVWEAWALQGAPWWCYAA
jgi:hypothetical protein